MKALTSGGGTSGTTNSLAGSREDNEAPSADAGTAFSASSAEIDRPAPSTEAPAPAEATRPRPRAEVPSVDRSGLESAYTRLQGLLQQAPDLSDKTADTANNYRQAHLEAERLEQSALVVLSSQTATAEEVAQVQAQLVASSNKLEASIAGLQVAVKPGVEPSATVEEKNTELAPVGKAPEVSNENASGATTTSPRESTAKAEESAPGSPAASPATDNSKPETVTYTVEYRDTETGQIVHSLQRQAVIPAGKDGITILEYGKELVNDSALAHYADLSGQSLVRQVDLARKETATIRYDVTRTQGPTEKTEGHHAYQPRQTELSYTVVYQDEQTGLEVYRETKTRTVQTTEPKASIGYTVKPDALVTSENLKGYQLATDLKEQLVTLTEGVYTEVTFKVKGQVKKRSTRDTDNTPSGTATYPDGSVVTWTTLGLPDNGDPQGFTDFKSKSDLGKLFEKIEFTSTGAVVKLKPGVSYAVTDKERIRKGTIYSSDYEPGFGRLLRTKGTGVTFAGLKYNKTLANGELVFDYIDNTFVKIKSLTTYGKVMRYKYVGDSWGEHNHTPAHMEEFIEKELEEYSPLKPIIRTVGDVSATYPDGSAVTWTT